MRNCVKLLKKAKKIALFSHENPDPDTVGSTIALCKMLRQKGKEVCLFCESEIPEDYFFLEEAKEYNTVELDDSFDLLCAVDVPTEDKLGKHTETFLNFSNTLRIDHHLKGSNFAKVNFVELQSACAVIVFDLAKKLGVKITEDIANAIYLAICGDTGTFHYNNTDSKTFDVCSSLLKCGANIRKVYESFFDKRTVSGVKMTANTLLNAEINDELGYVILTAKAEDYKKFNVPENDDNLGNLPNSYLNCGYKIAVILKEKSDLVRCSFRSKFEFDVSLIAEKFGGGGHKNASGCGIDKPLAEARNLVEKEIQEYLKVKGE